MQLSDILMNAPLPEGRLTATRPANHHDIVYNNTTTHGQDEKIRTRDQPIIGRLLAKGFSCQITNKQKHAICSNFLTWCFLLVPKWFFPKLCPGMLLHEDDQISLLQVVSPLPENKNHSPVLSRAINDEIYGCAYGFSYGHFACLPSDVVFVSLW